MIDHSARKSYGVKCLPLRVQGAEDWLAVKSELHRWLVDIRRDKEGKSNFIDTCCIDLECSSIVIFHGQPEKVWRSIDYLS